MDLIAELVASQNMATLLITHDLALAAEYCDRIAVMHAGHLVETGADRRCCSRRRAIPYTAKLIAATPGESAEPRRARRNSGRAARSAAHRSAGLPLRRALRASGDGLP